MRSTKTTTMNGARVGAFAGAATGRTGDRSECADLRGEPGGCGGRTHAASLIRSTARTRAGVARGFSRDLLIARTLGAAREQSQFRTSARDREVWRNVVCHVLGEHTAW